MTIITNPGTAWSCLRHPQEDLFYWVHSKCACTYYKSVLGSMSWHECTTRDIQWGRSRVFSHIRDPLRKHRSGLIEYFYFERCTHILETNLDDQDFWQMLAQTAWLDHHSMTAWALLGDLTAHVHWIPLDIPNRDHLKETLDYIQYTGPQDQLQQIPHKNVSQGFKKNCVDKLLCIDPDPLIIKYLEQDQVIYDRVSRAKGFEPHGYQKKIAQLLEQGCSQIEAEAVLDQQVADGSYLKW